MNCWGSIDVSNYAATRDRVEDYFDRSATRVWARLTSDAPVSGIRATVRAGRERMRQIMLDQLPRDLTGCRVLDAGCGPGVAAFELAERGAEVVAVDIAPNLIEIGQARCPAALKDRITWVSGDMLEAAKGRFDHAFAMDSLIYYAPEDVARVLMALPVDGRTVFSLPPRTPMLMAMWRAGQLFPKSNRAPRMVPQSGQQVAQALKDAGDRGRLREIERVHAKFYISTALVHEGGR